VRILPWKIGESERAEVLRRLRFDYFKWDVFAVGKCLVLPESLVLTQAEHARVVEVVERFAALLGRLENSLVQDREALRWLGIPEGAMEILQREPESELQIARYDIFPTDTGEWMISEFNEDVPGGFNEAIGLPELLGASVSDEAEFRGDLGASFREAYRQWEAVAFLFATGYSEDLQHMLILEKLLREAGQETVLASPAHLQGDWRGRARFFGKKFGAGFRFYPGEWMQKLPNKKTWVRLADRFPVMNPVRRLIRQSKRLFVWWDQPGVLTAEEREFVRAHTPESVEYEDARAAEWQSEPGEWVVKHAFGRMGDSVSMGCLESAAHWTRALEEASRHRGDFLLQRCFRNTPMDFADGPLFPAIGAFLVNGKFAGYYSRAASAPFLTHEAYHVTTLVEKNP
jgi:glutathionylspermidine synthase